MPKDIRLFGRPIRRTSDATLADQTYAVLRSEIAAGRWHEGDRLPGIAALAEQSGLSRAPLAEALRRLCTEGFLVQKPRAGTFLRTRTPEGLPPAGTVGVLLARPGTPGAPGSGWSQWRLHQVFETTSARHYVTEVVYMSPDDLRDDSHPDLTGLFSERVFGVLSLCSLPHLYGGVKFDHFPLVFLADFEDLPVPRCAPCVAPDLRHGFYLLTHHLIARGHRHITPFATRAGHETGYPQAYAGYAQAMRETGLKPHRKAYEVSRRLRRPDATGIDQFISSAPETTAVICLDTSAPRIAEWANARGIRIPVDLSVAGHTPSPLTPGEPTRRVTAIDYDLPAMVEACFDCLEYQHRRGRPPWTLMGALPRVAEGHSVAPPRSEKQIRLGTETPNR